MDDNDSDNQESFINGSESSDEEGFAGLLGNVRSAAQILGQRMGNAALVLTEEPIGSSQESQVQERENGQEHTDATPGESFDLDLPPEHLYLGDNLETVPGRIILTEGSCVTLPLLPKSYGTLIPGQTFPLTVRDYARTHMLRKCMEGDHTFGCIASSHGDVIGTTAEIYEFADDIGTVRIKAKARQRFKLLKVKRNEGGYFVGEVRILPEVELSKPLQTVQINSLNKLRTIQRERCQHRDAMMTVWPSWVYDQYDADKLVERVDKELTFLKQGLRQANGKITMPRDPSGLSFWIATHLDADERMFVIRLNSPIQRLRWQLSLMNKCQYYVCHSCQTQIGRQADVFAMSVEGAQNTYVNPHGFLHETITLKAATNLLLISIASTEYSWFPGYAWRIAVCESCRAHIGWQFIAEKSRMRPQRFWGLSRQSLVTKISMEGQEASDPPVM